MVTMFDSIDLSQFPENPQAVAGYVGGHWPTFKSLQFRFPRAFKLSIAVTASQRARCLDVEAGDAVPSQAPGWFRTLADRSQGKPVLYTSAAMVNSLLSAMHQAGIGRDEYLLWSAHYSGKEHICGPGTCGFPQADATQWTDKAFNRNLDQSLCADYFFGLPSPGPKPPTLEGYVAISTVVTADGNTHVFYEAKDGSLWYTWQRKGETAWHGGQENKQVAGLTPFAPAPK